MKIPSFDCLPGCTACCTIVPFTRSERDAATTLRPLTAWSRMNFGDTEHYTPTLALETLRCPFVVEGKGCGIYKHRPLACRLYGSVASPEMTCHMGAGPKQSRKIPDMEARLMILENEHK